MAWAVGAAVICPAVGSLEVGALAVAAAVALVGALAGAVEVAEAVPLGAGFLRAGSPVTGIVQLAATSSSPGTPLAGAAAIPSPMLP